MQPKCLVGKEKMLICHVETNLVFLPVVCQDPLPRRAWPAPTPGRFALIPKQNDIDSNQFGISFVTQLRASMPIFIKKYFKLRDLWTKKLSVWFFFAHPLLLQLLLKQLLQLLQQLLLQLLLQLLMQLLLQGIASMKNKWKTR